MKTITYKEFQAEMQAQGMAKVDLAFVCPMCGTVQSARDLIALDAGKDFDEVEQYLGFSCVGRWTGAGSPVKDSGKPCNWTLGGLFQMHEVEIVTDDGEHHKRFALATPEQAKAHADKPAEEVR